MTHFFRTVSNFPIHDFKLLGNISMGIAILFLLIVVLWIFFRKDTIKNNDGKILQDGTQKAWLVAIIGAIFPIMVAIAYVSSYVSSILAKAQRIRYSLVPIGLSGQRIVIYYLVAIIIALIISVIAYIFIRGCGAQSGCHRDIRFLKKFN